MSTKFGPFLKVLYGVAVITALFTGFGNMPLYGRYYVADLPGLGWSGNFFLNVNVHILAGSVLLAVAVYAFTASLLIRRLPVDRLSFSGKTRGLLLALTLLTGVVMVLKNLPAVHLPMKALIAFNFLHMGAAVLFMLAALISLIFRRPWTKTR
ncbi:hypothetical protein DSCW_33270 [Desulfosarcina widdelii]|uniref:FeS-binding protein n=1 Tax=Desulfosarcina widdelii TaxID=947919 RepID=A0A5K7Z5C1_9BACT|nr:FeS-binding protein [Desulfosarcina widdelii]BBO75910.1 hypothetical protein DSCW_33270 [Desulfosarcina widdelii]